MKVVMFREWYRLCHSKRIWIIIAFMLLMSVLMFFMSIGWRNELVYVWLDETEEDSENMLDYWEEMAQDVVNLIGKRHMDHNAGKFKQFWMTQKAMELFREGGALYEKYQEYHFPERMVLQQMLGGAIAPPEQEDFETSWKFHKMLTDLSSASWVAIIFTSLFFGMDFSKRMYQGALFAGQKRRTLFLGKYLFFFLLFMVLSFLELVAAIAVFIPKIWLLPASEIATGLFLRCVQDVGWAMICVPFAMLGKSEWKSAGLLFLFVLVFMSNRAMVNIDPYQFVTEAYWKTCSDMGISIKIVLVTIALFFTSGLLSAELLQRTELK